VRGSCPSPPPRNYRLSFFLSGFPSLLILPPPPLAQSPLPPPWLRPESAGLVLFFCPREWTRWRKAPGTGRGEGGREGERERERERDTVRGRREGYCAGTRAVGRGEGGEKGTAIVTFAFGSSLPFIPALRRPRQLREHASCSTGNERTNRPANQPASQQPMNQPTDRPIDRSIDRPTWPTRKRASRYRRCGNAERSIAGHRTFRCELIRLFRVVGSHGAPRRHV